MSHTRLHPAFTFTDEKLAELKRVAPEAFADGKVHWEVLKEALGEHVDDEGAEAEHFGLNWPGKRDARRMAGLPSTGALVPKPGDGINEDSTRNIFIEGENLEVLKLLQKSYAGKVKMIYIDPPYNTGNDFVYEDDFTEPLEEYLRRTGQVDEEGKALTTNTRADGRFHSKWLSMMYPRLRLARQLLCDDGAVFVSIDDNEVHHLRALMNEVFGEENFVGEIVWQRSKKGDAKLLARVHEYIVCFTRNTDAVLAEGVWRMPKEGADEVLTQYESFKKELKGKHEKIRGAMMDWYRALKDDDPRKAHKHYNWSDNRGLYFAADFAGPDDGRLNRPRHDILHPVTGKPCKKPSTGWRWDPEKTNWALGEKPPRIHFGPDETTIPCRKSYLNDISSEPFSTVFYRDGRAATLEVESLVGKGFFPFPKSKEVIGNLLQLATNGTDLVLDFFAGSGTTGQAVQELNAVDGGQRKFILVQLPEVLEDKHPGRKEGYKTIGDISKERLRRAFKKNKSTCGFKSLSLAHSNYTAWKDYHGTDAKALEDLFAAQETPLREGWSVEGLTTEVMLLEGFPLDSRVEVQKAFKKNTVQRIHHEWHQHALFVCLDKKIHADTIAALVLGEGDTFICLDTAIDDQSKLRLSDKGMIKTI